MAPHCMLLHPECAFTFTRMDLSADTHGGGYLRPCSWLLSCQSLRMSIPLCSVEGAEENAVIWLRNNTAHVFSIHSACIARFLTGVRKLTLAFKSREFYFLHSEATTTEKPAVAVFVSPWLSLHHWHTERHISARKAKAHAEKQSFPDDIGYLEAGWHTGWAGGHVGSLQAGWGQLGRD